MGFARSTAARVTSASIGTKRSNRSSSIPIGFAGPIKINDTVRVRFHVAGARLSRSRPGWGILVLPAELRNQHGEVVQRGEHRLMIPCRPGFTH